MATKLRKSVQRISCATIRERGKNRDVVVILQPPNILGFRLKGFHHTYYLTIEACYIMAVRAEIARIRAEKKKAKKEGRG